MRYSESLGPSEIGHSRRSAFFGRCQSQASSGVPETNAFLNGRRWPIAEDKDRFAGCRCAAGLSCRTRPVAGVRANRSRTAGVGTLRSREPTDGVASTPLVTMKRISPARLEIFDHQGTSPRATVLRARVQEGLYRIRPSATATIPTGRP